MYLPTRSIESCETLLHSVKWTEGKEDRNSIIGQSTTLQQSEATKVERRPADGDGAECRKIFQMKQHSKQQLVSDKD